MGSTRVTDGGMVIRLLPLGWRVDSVRDCVGWRNLELGDVEDWVYQLHVVW